MSDFFSWFVAKHWFVSAVLFPEIAFAFAVWQRWWCWATLVGVGILIKYFWKIFWAVLWRPAEWRDS